MLPHVGWPRAGYHVHQLVGARVYPIHIEHQIVEIASVDDVEGIAPDVLDALLPLLDKIKTRIIAEELNVHVDDQVLSAKGDS